MEITRFLWLKVTDTIVTNDNTYTYNLTYQRKLKTFCYSPEKNSNLAVVLTLTVNPAVHKFCLTTELLQK